MLLTFSTVIIALLLTFYWIKESKSKENNLLSENFIKGRILLDEEKKEEAKRYFENIVENGNDFYSLLALNTIVKNDNLKKTIEDMKEHEVEHCQFFENEIKKRNIEPTKFLPLWDLLGVGLGFGSTILGKKAAMLCTASVEEVIDKHYQDQINQLGPEEKNLKKKIIKFREDELHHKDIAYEKGATKKGIYSIMDKIIKTGSKIAIRISEKV